MMDDRLDPKTTALVVIDLQRGILDADREPHSPADVLARCAALAKAFRAKGGLVVLVNVDFAANYADALNQPVDAPTVRPQGGMAAGWADLAPELEAGRGDILVTKRQWGAFYGTGLELELRRRGIRTMVLGGIATNYGVESTARDGWERGFEIVFVEDAMTSSPDGAHAFSVKTIFPRIGCVRSTRQVLDAL